MPKSLTSTGLGAIIGDKACYKEYGMRDKKFQYAQYPLLQGQWPTHCPREQVAERAYRREFQERNGQPK